ncbi:hypothetical protein HN51_030572 [Arachis hypogaea]
MSFVDLGMTLVEEIYVKNCTFSGTINGARIKTWQGGSGYAKSITFEDIILDKAENPVIINQQYYANDAYGEGAVEVSDITYHNVKGTSMSENAIVLNCEAKYLAPAL